MDARWSLLCSCVGFCRCHVGSVGCRCVVLYRLGRQDVSTGLSGSLTGIGCGEWALMGILVSVVFVLCSVGFMWFSVV